MNFAPKAPKGPNKPFIGHSLTGAVHRPKAPKITSADLRRQFVVDVYGKEVQDPSSYSYTWIADQAGHVGLGILVYFGVALIVDIATGGWGSSLTKVLGVIAGALVVAAYELRTFVKPAQKLNGLFPLDKKLLAANAFVAWCYLFLGVVAGLALHLTLERETVWYGVGIFLILVALAILLAPSWLRQKIIWQKADLPFVYRLANVPRDIAPPQAQTLADALLELVNEKTFSDAHPRQVVIGGPIGSGRTEMAAAIGTEFAFNDCKVRYVTFTALLEFAQTLPPSLRDRNDSGPDNINYWPWIDAQVLIIDDVGPLISAQPNADKRAAFERLLTNDDDLGRAAKYLRKCHTVWVLGNHSGSTSERDSQTTASTVAPALEAFADVIVRHCHGKLGDQLVIELANRKDPGPKGPAPVQVKALSNA